MTRGEPAPGGGDNVRVRVPATSANLGPGFDALGLALDLYEEIRLRRLSTAEVADARPGSLAGTLSTGTLSTDASSRAPRPRITVRGVGTGRMPADENLLAYQGALAVYRRLGRDVPLLALELESRIPRSGGLGGSAAATVGGAVAANALEGYPLQARELLEIATALEGHPDNAAAALLGGLVISVRGRDGLVAKRVEPPPGLVAVLCLPHQAISTKQARGGVLPREVPLEDAVFNLGRTALLVAAFSSADWSLLRDAMDDRLHQPARGRLYPALHPTVAAALAAGAHGAALSGSGSAIIALATEREAEIAVAMRTAAEAHGYPGATAIVALASAGATVL
ncbi:MAG: homoserine kinase [Chloroflexota bacterium]|nr:homoserine kinase [Chloroflexota bacterium]